MCRGIDLRDFGHKLRKSVSAEVNYGIRFKSQEESHAFLQSLANEVSTRLQNQQFLTRMLTLKVMKRATEAEPRKHLGHGVCDTISKSHHLNKPTHEPALIFETLLLLLNSLEIPPEDLRGIGVTCTLLFPASQHSVSDLLMKSASGAVVRAPTTRAPLYKREEIDRSVLMALPIQIQQELNDELQLTPSIPSKFDMASRAKLGARKRKKTSLFNADQSKRDSHAGAAKTSRPPPTSLARTFTDEFSTTFTPSLLGRTSLDELRPLLRQWLEFTAAQMEITDTEADLAILHVYLDELVQARQLHTLVLVVRYIVFVAQQVRLDGFAAAVVAHVQAQVRERYQCNLQI